MRARRALVAVIDRGDPDRPGAVAGTARGAHIGLAAALAAVGSVCGAVVTDAVQNLAGAPAAGYWNLAGVVVGAALPQLIGSPGAYWRLRAAAGIAVTAVAILLTYSGLKVAAEVPALRQVVPPLPSAAVVEEEVKEEEVTGAFPADSGPGIRILPAGPLNCTPAGCPGPVTIHSTGTAALRIDEIDFDGPAADDFEHRGQCEHREFAPGEECSLRIAFDPSGSASTGRARLVVNQNLPGPPSYLVLEGAAARPRPDLVPSTRVAGCRVVDTGGRRRLQVWFELVNDGAEIDQPTVGVTARSAAGADVTYRPVIGLTTFTIPIVPGDTIVVTVDPADEIAEQDEANNRMLVTLPSAAGKPCRIARS